MTRRLLAAAALVALALPGVASASGYSVRNPVDGCVYSVWTPTYTITTFVKPGITSTGGFGHSVECP